MFKLINRQRNKKGFTLIELVVVIAIIGILALIAIPRFTGARLNANQGAVIANLRTIQNAAEIYAAQENIPIASVSNAGVVSVLGGAAMPAGPGNITYTMATNAGDATAVLGTGDAAILPASPILRYSLIQ